MREAERARRAVRASLGASRSGLSRSLHGGALAAVLCAALLLPACAREPVLDWEPPMREPVHGVALAAGEDAEAGAEEAAGRAGGADPRPEAEAASEPSASEHRGPAPTTADQRSLGLLPERLRNDELSLAARFVYVPGVPDFNERVDRELRAVIEASGLPYSPQAHPSDAGLSDRGCVPGSSHWAPAEVLARAETGPVGGSGTAIVCELAGAFGSLVEVRLRVVKGSAEAVSVDRTIVLFADLASGKTVEIVEEWSDAAPAELWLSAVELLRRAAGSLSTAPLAEPDAEQLALADAALGTARSTEGGGLLVTVPAGLASPELQGLGIERTEQPLRLRIEPATALAWSNPEYRDLHRELGTPFAGVAAAASTVPIDCDLLPCIAITYDDGPSDGTPQLLDTLRAEQARATFFMLGRQVAGRADTVARADAEGHEIGSHTMGHPDLTTLPLPEAAAQVLDAAAEVRRVTGRPVTMFRPPYGEVNDKIIEAVGMPAILWNIDTNDWREPGREALVERASGGADPGDIVLFHDTHSDTVAAAGDVVHALRDRGFELVTVTQLFGGQVPAGRVRSR